MSATAEQQIILVTGGNNGIGFDTVAALTSASPTHHVIIGSRNLSKGTSALSSIRAKHHPGTTSLIQLDVTSDTSIQDAFACIERDFGRLDVLINNAGICPEPKDAAWPGREEMREIFETNVFGPTVVTKVMLPLLSKSKDPRIVNVTSSLGSISTRLDPTDVVSGANYPAYRMSKASLNMLTAFTYTLGQSEQSGHCKGVKVWSFCPGYVVTDLGGDRELKTSTGVDSSETSAKGILEIVQGKRDGDVGRFVEREGRSRVW
ncbi:NAD(P)-binding protein [Macroventuria anomochaeta]|uniref:NAD(P)-binding protein n=1 Tax=Macroventuria anomochaeta TaxID=301207 RepID=A0ACB6RXV0_9PLEO|nr:NAD(P)-binding protein [Macroventuria anomochaeta]KAF2626245.1 NAD(P)-binding protein [Macroventuria anomochaeta]